MAPITHACPHAYGDLEPRLAVASLSTVERVGRTLVVDDDADIARVFVDVLADCGVSAVAADHERLPEDDLISLVITDLKHCNGYSSDAAVRWVEQLRERYRAPVIVVTGRSEALADETLARVAADVMGKPIDMDDFVMRVGKALGE